MHKRIRRLRHRAILLAIALGAPFAGPAVAQGGATPPLPKAPTAPPVSPGHPTRTVPEQIQPPIVQTTPSPTTELPTAPAGTLSRKLSEQEGILKPPVGIDPGMKVSPPESGRIIVIPPPGSPGNPSVQGPK